MNKTKIGIALCSALLGFAVHGQPSVEVGISIPVPSVGLEIHAESDFYEPLAPQGEWVVIGSYGRCWRPSHVERDWRPYCNGRWEQTDLGWYWASDEPWAWATYHYGRWDYTDNYGWYWMPQTQWAPAWVSWHSGGGYVGWAPLQPSVRISAGGFVGFEQSRISPRAFVFVKEGGFMEPVRPSTVVVNSTTIINKTVVINNTKVVNNTVINGGPTTAVIEKASGRKVQVAAVHELRHKEEAQVAARQRTPAPANEKKASAPVRAEAAPVEKKPVTTQERPPVEKKPVTTQERAPVEKPAIVSHEPARPVQKNNVSPVEKHAPVSATSEARPEANRSPVIKEPAGANPSQHLDNQEKTAKPVDKRNQRPTREKPAASEKSGPGAADKEHENKPKQ